LVRSPSRSSAARSTVEATARGVQEFGSTRRNSSSTPTERTGTARVSRSSVVGAVPEQQQGAQDVFDRGGEDVAAQLVARREVLRGALQRLARPDAPPPPPRPR